MANNYDTTDLYIQYKTILECTPFKVVLFSVCINIYTHMHTYIYIYTNYACMYVCKCIYRFMYVE